MSALDRAIERGLSSGIKAGLGKAMDRAAPRMIDMVLSALWRNPTYPVIAGGQLRLIECGIEPVRAWECSRNAFREFLKDERIKFGDPRYGWDAASGREIVDEYCVRYLEPRP